MALGLGEGQHFCVGGGVFEGFNLVPGTGDDVVLTHDDRANGDFILGGGAPGLSQSLAHEMIVASEVNGGAGFHESNKGGGGRRGQLGTAGKRNARGPRHDKACCRCFRQDLAGFASSPSTAPDNMVHTLEPEEHKRE